MEITQRIKSRLKQVRDWTAVIDELEADADNLTDNAEQSKMLFELARACEEIFLDKARAMQCYQKAFKLDQSNLLALQHAREIYHQMASLEMVTRLMGLELRVNCPWENICAVDTWQSGAATRYQRGGSSTETFGVVRDMR